MSRGLGDRASVLNATESEVLGDGSDGMEEVERRLLAAYPGASVIAWEGDAATFAFEYVSPAAASLLGHAIERWTSEPAFWAEHVVVEEDQSDAIAYCALATAGRRDHVFEYRARTADGRVRVLRDVVRVIVGAKGIPERLRGLMFDVSAERESELSSAQLRARQAPPIAELERDRAVDTAR